MVHLCYLCLVFVMLSRLFIASLWSPAGKGLTSWLSLVMFKCVFVTFPCSILGQVWYLIVPVPDLCKGGGCTLIVSHIRKLRSFWGLTILSFNIFGGFSGKYFFFWYEDFVDILLG